MTEIAWTPAGELAQAVRRRRLSPVEIADALLARVEAVNPGINAYVHVDPDRVRRRARDLETAVMRGDELGVLHGVPYSIKDLTAVAGLPLTLGLVPLRDQIAWASAVVVERLERAGRCLLGKTNTPEGGYYGVTDNHLFGPTRSPWRRDRIAGGSSGGAAGAVAAGLGPLAEGSDGAGSIRIPASRRRSLRPNAWSSEAHSGGCPTRATSPWSHFFSVSHWSSAAPCFLPTLPVGVTDSRRPGANLHAAGLAIAQP